MAISAFGNAAQYLSLLLSVYAILAAVLGAFARDRRFVESSRRAVIGTGAMMTLATAALTWALMVGDYGNEYVYAYSSKVLPAFYKMTALWAGQKGSLLFWGWLVAVFGAAVALVSRKREEEPATPWVYAYTMVVVAFFTWLVCFVVNPFERLPQAMADGRGLNPLLQNLGMVYHPPTLFIGYAGFTIPFAYMLASLTTGGIDATWIKRTRFWTVASWIFLTIGIVLGGWWAYMELGWGGYWAWDPVENSSFMPWLTATALLHSTMLQERKRMLKVWNVILVMLSFTLCIVGTFITRSGVVQSVHTFPESPLGKYFLGLIIACVVGTVALLLLRLPRLRHEGEIETLVSKEGAFLANNVIFSLLTFSVFMGTLWPVFTQLFTGQQVSLNAAFFNSVNIPVFIILAALMAVCPLIGWQRTSLPTLLRMMIAPVAIGVFAGAVAAVKFGVTEAKPLVTIVLIFLALSVLAGEFWRGAVARRQGSGEALPKALLSAVNRNRRRYGGYVVHIGIFIIYLGILGSSNYKLSMDRELAAGQSFEIGRYTITYKGLRIERLPDYLTLKGMVEVAENGRKVGIMAPERRYYFHWEQPSAEVAVLPTLRDDLYLILASPSVDSENLQRITVGDYTDVRAGFKVNIEPLINWIWIGCIVSVVGGAWALAPRRRREEA